MSEITTIGLDLAKQVFQVHGADASGVAVLKKRLSRGKVLAFFAKQAPCLVAMEACGSAHHWAREIRALGHEVRLIPPAYVKPYVKRQKNDAADAEAICEAVQRPSMRFVPVKSVEQQASAAIFRVRDLLVRQRTQLVNSLRGHLAEFGWVAPKGLGHVAELIAAVEEPDCAFLQSARGALMVLVDSIQTLEQQIDGLDREIALRARQDETSRHLTTIPGFGPIISVALPALAPPPETFRSGRDFAAWLGLTPLQKSTGGKQKLGAISKMGERTLRRLLIIGASAVVSQACRRGAPAGSWLAKMLARKPRMLVTVALANKMARIAWAVMLRNEDYRAPAVAA